MKHTFSIIFYLRRKEYQPSSIIARVTINGQASTINTQLKCLPDEWDTRSYRVTVDTSEANFINDTLASIKARISQIYYQQTLCDGDVTSQMVKEIYTGLAYKKSHLISYFGLYNENFKKQIGISRSKATSQKYEAIRTHLINFLKSERKLEDIPLYKINHKFIYEFEIYLRTVSKCNQNSTAKFMQLFKRIIILAQKDGLIKTDPFQQYQIKLQRVDREFLTMEELKQMIQIQLPSQRLEIVRDLFVFSSFTGLAYVDLKNLNQTHISIAVDGYSWLRFTRWKTNEMSSIRLFEIPLKLIEKYHDPARETLFPVPCNQKLNLYLKEVAEIAGIKKRITFHVARHTCATTIALSNGMPMESLAKLLGHKNVRTTQLYARITDMKLNEDMQQLEERLAYII